MLSRKALYITTGAASLALGFCVPTYAQQSAGQTVTLEEVVVTARKREENLMTTPLAITAFTSKDVESEDLKDLNDISAHTPGLYFQNQVGGGSGRNDRSINQITFRGLTLANNYGVTAGGLLFVDGAPVIGGSAGGLDSIERVEVLKGPQSAYFGRSTFAGAVNYVTRDPSDEFKGRVSAEYSSYGSTNDSISLEGPLVKDILDARISGYHNIEGGEYTNAADTNQKFGERGTDAVTATFLLKPSDQFKIKAFFDYFINDDGPPAQGALKGSELPCNRAGTLGSYICGTVPNKLPTQDISGDYVLNSYSAPILINNSDHFYTVIPSNFLTHAGLRREAIQSDVKADYETTSGYTIESLTAYHRDESASLIDLDFRDGHNVPSLGIPGAPPYSWWYLSVAGLTHDLSEEVRISSPSQDRFRWNFGGNYLYAINNGQTVEGFSIFGPLPPSGVTKLYNQTPAVFTGLYFDIMPKLTLSGEARYQWDKITSQALTDAGGNPLTNGPMFNKTYGSFSPRVTLDYKFMDNSTVYALWSRGYRPGGFNTILATIAPSVLSQYFAPVGAQLNYQQERLDNIEAGIKATFLDNRASVNADVYKEYWTNGQVSTNVLYFVPGNSNVQLASPTENIGKVDLQGIEAEAHLQATNHLNLSATFGLNDSSIKSFFCVDCLYIYGNSNANGHELAISPKFNWTVDAEYTDHLAGAYDWYGRIDYTHRGSYFADYANVARNTAADVVNLRIGVRSDTITIEGFVTNLFRNTSPEIVQGTDLFTVASTLELRYGLPQLRKFGIRGTYNF